MCKGIDGTRADNSSLLGASDTLGAARACFAAPDALLEAGVQGLDADHQQVCCMHAKLKPSLVMQQSLQSICSECVLQASLTMYTPAWCKMARRHGGWALQQIAEFIVFALLVAL